MYETWPNDTKPLRCLNVLSSCAKGYGKSINVVDKWCAKIILRVHTGNDWNKIINREVIIMKVKYPFLPERQVMGKAFEKFGIPAIMGSIVRPSVLNLQGGIVKQLFKNQDLKSKMYHTRKSYKRKRMSSKPEPNYFERNERIFQFVTDSTDEGPLRESDRKPAKRENTRFQCTFESTESNAVEPRTEKESSPATLTKEKRMLNKLFKSDESSCSKENITDYFWYPNSKMTDLRFGSSKCDRSKIQEKRRSSNDQDYNCPPTSVRSEYLNSNSQQRLPCEFKKTNLKSFGNSNESDKISTDMPLDVNRNIVKIRESDLEQDSMSEKPSRLNFLTRSSYLGSRDPTNEKEMQFLTISSKGNKNLPFIVKTKDITSPIHSDFSNHIVHQDISKFKQNSFETTTFYDKEKTFSDIVASFKNDNTKNRMRARKTFSGIDDVSKTPIKSVLQFSSGEENNNDFSDRNSNRSVDLFCTPSSTIDKTLEYNFKRGETFDPPLDRGFSSIAKTEKRIFYDKIIVENLRESREIEVKSPKTNVSHETGISISTTKFDPTMLTNYCCEYDSPCLKRASMPAMYAENISMRPKNIEDRKTIMRTDIRRKVNRIVSQLDIVDYEKM